MGLAARSEAANCRAIRPWPEPRLVCRLNGESIEGSAYTPTDMRKSRFTEEQITSYDPRLAGKTGALRLSRGLWKFVAGFQGAGSVYDCERLSLKDFVPVSSSITPNPISERSARALPGPDRGWIEAAA